MENRLHAYTDKELKAELKRREKSGKKLPWLVGVLAIPFLLGFLVVMCAIGCVAIVVGGLTGNVTGKFDW